MNSSQTPMVFEYDWSYTSIGEDAVSIEDMIIGLLGAVARLQEMAAAGVTLDLENSHMDSDYALLITEDPAVAGRLGFTKPLRERRQKQ